ncbi:hypothetical protein [Nonomuraea sp. NPDC049141]|uniref:hypothetical protein n=1 Tax=Nonomuraea sp. NPDC049141 TaxID=3155500 RepID=UPI0033C4EB21
MFLVGALLLARTPLVATYLIDVLPSMLLLGLGSGLSLRPIMTLAMSAVGEAQVGVISGLANSTGQVSGALWVAIAASIVSCVTAALTRGVPPSGSP